MVPAFTVEQFHGVSRDYNTTVWPAQWLLVAMALAAVAAVLKPRPWSGVAVSAILGGLWAWIALAYHLAFFARISPAAYGFAVLSAAGAAGFIWWVPGLKAMAGVVLIAFALVVYPVWSAYAGYPYPATPTFGLPCPTAIFTIGLLCFSATPTPRSPLVVPVLWCLIGAQAAFLLDVQPDLGLIAAGLVGIALIASAGRPLRTQKP